MKLTSLPQMKSNPQLFSAEAGRRFSDAQKVQKAVTNLFDDYAVGLSELDGQDIDFNGTDGEVVVVDRYLSGRYEGGSGKVKAAEINFDKETGNVQKFQVIQEDGDSYRFEYERHDEYRSSNPTFEAIENGQKTKFELNPNTGLMVGFQN